VSFVYQFSGIFASGLTPIIATALIRYQNGSPTLVCLYVALAGVVSALSAYWIGLRQKNGEPEAVKDVSAGSQPVL
jgi:membrane protein DedA with SNARE-associated domain